MTESSHHSATGTISDDEIMQQAATWLVTLDSEQCTAQDIKDFAHWQQQSPKHKTIADEMQGTLLQFKKIQQQPSSKFSSQIIEQTLSASSESQLFRPLVLWLVTMGLLILCLSYPMLPSKHWLADYKNDYNQWLKQSLSDHSEIQISGSSAFDVDFNQQERLVKLYQGNILVDVAKDAQRPFVIETEFAQITALGTRFIVQQYSDATILIMLESKARVQSRIDQSKVIELHAGQAVRIDKFARLQPQQVSANLIEQAWHKHLYVADQQPLDHVLAHLANYHSKTLSYDAKLLHPIMVNATLPLDDSGLELMAESLDLQLEPKLFNKIKISKK
jgi:transmembrane sensor